jgi:hypothetical protein
LISLVKILHVEPLGGHRLRIGFSDGTAGDYDFAADIAAGGPMIEPLRDPAFFARVFIELGALAWPNGYDIDPIALHADMRDAGLLRRGADAA